MLIHFITDGMYCLNISFQNYKYNDDYYDDIKYLKIPPDVLETLTN